MPRKHPRPAAKKALAKLRARCAVLAEERARKAKGLWPRTGRWSSHKPTVFDVEKRAQGVHVIGPGYLTGLAGMLLASMRRKGRKDR